MEMDMSNEKAPTSKVCLPIGWRVFKIKECKEATSKKNNPMIVFTLLDKDTQTLHDVYAITEPGKRWFLKSLLSACEVPASQDGVYKWEFVDVLLKEIEGLVIHEDNNWIDRKGNQRSDKQSKITDFRPLEKAPF